MITSKVQQATAVAILFHAIGLIGILFFNKAFFIASTPFNLLLMLMLIFYTQQQINKWFLLFTAVCVCIGFVVEIIGTSTGLLFGEYNYGKTLGAGFKNVPFVIGVNWFIIMYCCGITVHMVLKKLTIKVAEASGQDATITNKPLQIFSLVSDAAMLAVFFDWVLEPVAVKLGYWQWLGNGTIPTYNYLCWFLISGLLQFLFNIMPFIKHNKFAVNLLIIMLIFFMLLKIYL